MLSVKPLRPVYLIKQLLSAGIEGQIFTTTAGWMMGKLIQIIPLWTLWPQSEMS